MVLILPVVMEDENYDDEVAACTYSEPSAPPASKCSSMMQAASAEMQAMQVSNVEPVGREKELTVVVVAPVIVPAVAAVDAEAVVIVDAVAVMMGACMGRVSIKRDLNCGQVPVQGRPLRS
jgi:hypothetical protein